MNKQPLLKVASIALVSLCALSGVAQADPHPRRDGVPDRRYDHDHYYPPRGTYVRELPRGYYQSSYRGSPYYFQGGVWYRAHGPRYVVTRPPLGISVGVLPPFYTTVYFGGVPYYYADETYYRWYPEQHAYVVTEPPASEGSVAPSTPAAATTDLFIYPKNGQPEQQQATDRYECHAWAKQQTGFDPTQPLGGVDEAQSASKRADYRRADGACLEARGYTVK